jgi:hypothetical protein
LDTGVHSTRNRLKDVVAIAACAALLAKNGVKAIKPDASRLLVPPAEAAHLTIEFVQ